LERLSIKHAFDGIGYDIKPSGSLLEQDEEFSFTTTITNTKRWPMEFLRSGEFLPEDIRLLEAEIAMMTYPRGKALVSDTYLMPRQKITRTLKASLPRRGNYFFWGATLTAGSFLGLSEEVKEFHLIHEVVLPPKRVDMYEFEQLLGRFIGDISINRFILEDPILTIGFRDYTSRDPMRSISWLQTARLDKLMVRNYDHTLDLTVTVILNADKTAQAELETIFSLTRTVCDFLETSEIPYRLVTNATVGESGGRAIIPDGFGGDHAAAVLKFLGRATYNTFESFEDLLAKIAHGAEQGRAHILLTSKITQAASPFLYKLRARTGRDVLVITPETLKDLERMAAVI
jgi:uncharacterized protein (DUF58 family)